MMPFHMTMEGWVALILVGALTLIVRKAVTRRNQQDDRGLGL